MAPRRLTTTEDPFEGQTKTALVQKLQSAVRDSQGGGRASYAERSRPEWWVVGTHVTFCDGDVGVVMPFASHSKAAWTCFGARAALCLWQGFCHGERLWELEDEGDGGASDTLESVMSGKKEEVVEEPGQTKSNSPVGNSVKPVAVPAPRRPDTKASPKVVLAEETASVPAPSRLRGKKASPAPIPSTEIPSPTASPASSAPRSTSSAFASPASSFSASSASASPSPRPIRRRRAKLTGRTRAARAQTPPESPAIVHAAPPARSTHAGRKGAPEDRSAADTPPVAARRAKRTKKAPAGGGGADPGRAKKLSDAAVPDHPPSAAPPAATRSRRQPAAQLDVPAIPQATPVRKQTDAMANAGALPSPPARTRARKQSDALAEADAAPSVPLRTRARKQSDTLADADAASSPPVRTRARKQSDALTGVDVASPSARRGKRKQADALPAAAAASRNAAPAAPATRTRRGRKRSASGLVPVAARGAPNGVGGRDRQCPDVISVSSGGWKPDAILISSGRKKRPAPDEEFAEPLPRARVVRRRGTKAVPVAEGVASDKGDGGTVSQSVLGDAMVTDQGEGEGSGPSADGKELLSSDQRKDPKNGRKPLSERHDNGSNKQPKRKQHRQKADKVAVDRKRSEKAATAGSGADASMTLGATRRIVRQGNNSKRSKLITDKVARLRHLLATRLEELEVETNRRILRIKYQTQAAIYNVELKYRTYKSKYSPEVLAMPISEFAKLHGGNLDSVLMKETESGVWRTMSKLRGETDDEGEDNDELNGSVKSGSDDTFKSPPPPAAIQERRMAGLQTARKAVQQFRTAQAAEETPRTTLRRSQRTAAKASVLRTRAIIGQAPAATPRSRRAGEMLYSARGSPVQVVRGGDARSLMESVRKLCETARRGGGRGGAATLAKLCEDIARYEREYIAEAE